MGEGKERRKHAIYMGEKWSREKEGMKMNERARGKSI
jgi:hypothetical protein